MAKSLHNKELFPSHLLAEKDNGEAKRLSRILEIPIVSEFALLVAALGSFIIFAFVFLDFSDSKFMSLFGL